jgi:cob(I)alamin adenosyltransferase
LRKKAFYTRMGDLGLTGILGESRIAKCDPRIDAIGAVDEANAALGLFRSLLDPSDDVFQSVLQIQKKLYFLMSDLASEDAASEKFVQISNEDVTWLENEIARFEEKIEIPREFIVPGDHPLGAIMDLARTVVRRAEREIVRFYQQSPERNPVVLQFVNRLSSFCYLVELYVLKIKKDIEITNVKNL